MLTPFSNFTDLLVARATGHQSERCKKPPTPLGLMVLHAKASAQSHQFMTKLLTLICCAGVQASALKACLLALRFGPKAQPITQR
jgi:hypothetical protein